MPQEAGWCRIIRPWLYVVGLNATRPIRPDGCPSLKGREPGVDNDLHTRPARYEAMTYNRCGAVRPEAAGDLARPLAQFRRNVAASRRSGRCAARLRSRHHAFRPRQQLRPAAGIGGGGFGEILRPISPATATRSSSRPRPAIGMWPGPYGEWGSRKYLLASLDQSLRRHGARLCRHLLLAPLRSGHAA